MEKYGFPVWATQGGGLVRDVRGTYIFVEQPDCPGLNVGDEMPEEWGIIPANNLARQEQEIDDYCHPMPELPPIRSLSVSF